MRGSLLLVAGVWMGLGAGACNKDGAAPTEPGGAAEVGGLPVVGVPETLPAPAEDTVAPVSAAATDATAAGEVGAPVEVAKPGAETGLAPEQIARFAVTVAEIDCTADRFEDPLAQEKAISAILTRAGLTRDQYDAQVMKYLEDPTFNATREKSLEMCQAAHASNPAGAAGAAPADPEASLRQKMMSLAVASECMRKAGATSAEMAPALLALYRAHDVDVATYAKEMSRLQTNVQFQEEVAAKVAECPTGTAPAADPVDGDPGVAADPGGGEADVAELPPVVAPEVPAVPGTPVKPAPVAIGGVYLGTVSGGGSVRLTVGASGNISPAMLTIAGMHYRAKGRVDKSHAVSVAATVGRDWVQLKGRLDPARRTITGTWSGVIGGERKSGSFSAKR